MTITLTTADLYAIVLVSGLIGGTLATYGVRFLTWSDARRVRGYVSDDPQSEYRERAL